MSRVRLAKGIYRDRSGIVIRISVNGQPVDFRRDPEGKPYKDRDLPWLKQERIRRQAAATQHAERKAERADTFPADVQTFLKTLSGGHRLNTQGYMKHWAEPFKEHQRNAITELDVQTVFAKIDKGPSTKRHIRRALVNFYSTLNGVSGYNPARVLTPPPKRQEDARAIPYPLIERIFAALQPSRARARLKVLAYVGLPQKQIAQLQPSDLRLKERELIAHPRRKGAGAAGRALPLSAKAIEALQEFVALDAFGTFQNSQLVRTFKLGAKRAGVTLADDARPYDLRHSFLTEIYRQTGDPFAVSELGMHATLEQTQRYAKGAVSERATKAIRAVPRFLTTTARRNDPIRSTSAQRAKGQRGKKQPARRGRKRRKS